MKSYKSSEYPLISIITVVYNGAKTIENTIISVVRQTYKKIEYIIIDGNSSDSTIEIINKYRPSISFLLSEPDYGIYDAMNKGISLCNGDWVLLLNSDDILFYNDIVEQISIHLMRTYADIIHANIIVKYPNGKIRRNVPDNESMLVHGMCLNHGSCFIRKSVYNHRVYSLNYKIASDYDFLLWCYLKNYSFEYINKDIILFSAQGITGSPNFACIDAYKIWKNYFGNPKALFKLLKDFLPKIIKVPIKILFMKLKLY